MIMLKPWASLSIAGTTAAISPLRTLRVTRRLVGGIDELRFAMALNAGLTVGEGDEIGLELGWDGSGERVFSGRANAIDYGVSEARVTAYGEQRALATTRIDETFIDQDSGDVVQALAQRAGLPLGTVAAGVRVGKYHADGSRNLFEHMTELARLNGVDLFTDRAGQLNFTRRDPRTANYTVQFGVNLIAVNLQQGIGAVTAVEVVPESAAGNAGTEAASWLVKSSRDQAASAGDGEPRRFSSALCTTRETAASAAEAVRRELTRRAVRGRVLVMGLPAAQPGESVQLVDLPDGVNDGLYQIAAVEHALDAIIGFRTTLQLWGQP